MRDWLAAMPDWLEVHQAPAAPIPIGIHRGEAAAIALAQALKADLVLMDDQAGREFAEGKGLRVTGLLGVLMDAGWQGLVDFRSKLQRLESGTNFRMSRVLRDQMLLDWERGREGE